MKPRSTQLTIWASFSWGREKPIQQDERIADLQAQLAALKQENIDLRCQLTQQSDSCLQSCESSRTQLQLGDRSSRVEHRLLEATAIATNALLTIASFDEAINTALQILGESLETDRIRVIEIFAHPLVKINDLPFLGDPYLWD